MFPTVQTNTIDLLAILDICGQGLFFSPLHIPWVSVRGSKILVMWQDFLQLCVYLQNNLQMKFNARKFNVRRESGITWSVFCKPQSSKTCFHVTRNFELQNETNGPWSGLKKVLVHWCLRWIVRFFKRQTPAKQSGGLSPSIGLILVYSLCIKRG